MKIGKPTAFHFFGLRLSDPSQALKSKKIIITFDDGLNGEIIILAVLNLCNFPLHLGNN